MNTIKLPKDCKLSKAIDINLEWNPDVDPRKWIKWDKDWATWKIHDPTAIVGEVCVGKPNCELCIYHDPEYGLLPSVKFGKALRKYARCENCEIPPTADFGLCPCGSKYWFCYGETSGYLVSYEVWQSKLESLCREEWHRVKNKRRYLRKQLERLKSGKNPYTPNDIEKLRSIQDDTCYYCGTSISESFHIEHLEPLSRDGADTLKNIMLACPKCNLDKGSLSEAQYWRILQERLSESYFRKVRKSAKAMKIEKRKRLCCV